MLWAKTYFPVSVSPVITFDESACATFLATATDLSKTSLVPTMQEKENVATSPVENLFLRTVCLQPFET